MSLRCKVCLGGRSEAVEALDAAGWSRTRISEELGLPRQSVNRHLLHHAGRDGSPDATRASRRRRDTTGAHPAASAQPNAAAAVVLTPVDTFRAAFGQDPMDYQADYLTEELPTVFRKGRQIGATQAAAALALHTARSKAGALAAVISPSLRQSSEVASRARVGAWELGETLVQDSVSLIRLANGSRILSLPGSARGIRGYACDVVILDEAAWIPEDVWAAARPLVSATGGRLIAQSTVGVPDGWFYQLATDTPPGWRSMVVRSTEVPTIDPAFLAREQAEMDPVLYAQEYLAEWPPPGGGMALFEADQIAGLVRDDEQPYRFERRDIS